MIGIRLWQIAGWTMLHYFWVGAALGVMALLVRRYLRPAPANVCYLFALGTLLLLSGAPVPIAAVVMQNMAPLPQEAPPSVGLPADTATRSDTAHFEEMRPTMAATPMSAPVADINSPVEMSESPISERFLAVVHWAVMCLPWFWILGAPLTFALTTAGLLGAERLRRQSRLLEDARISEMCRQLAESLRISYRVSVGICDRIAAPILVGILRPMILLPAAALAGWDPQQLEMVLLHELAHVRRYDNLVNLLQRIVESLLFFHPMVWIASGWVRREREHCCDELVVARTRQPHVYANILVTMAERLSQGALQSSSLVHPQVFSSMAERPLVARVRRILKKEEQSMQVSRKAVALVLTGLLTIAAIIGGYCSLPSNAEDAHTALQKPVVGESFLILPLASMTDLQRNYRWNYNNAKLFVIINGETLLNGKDTTFNTAALDHQGFAAALSKYKSAVGGFTILEVDNQSQGSPSASRMLDDYLQKEAHLTAREIEMSYWIGRDGMPHKDWKSLVADLCAPPTEEAIRREMGVGDDLVRVYPVCTPLSRHFAGDGVDCVVRNMKPLDHLTPEDMHSFYDRVKGNIAKLDLKQPPGLCIVIDMGASLSKTRRAWDGLRLGSVPSWSEQGLNFRKLSVWDGRGFAKPKLLIAVVGEDGNAVKDARISIAFSPEIKEWNDRVKFTKQTDGRWCSQVMPRDEDFTVTVEAEGYEPKSEKLELPEGATRELAVKLRKRP